MADGVWQQTPAGPEFRRVPPPTRAQLDRLLATLTRRIARHLVRRGWLSEDAEGAALTGEDLGDSGLGTLRAHSITYRIAVGPNAGRKALTLRTLPGREDEPATGLLAKADGFSLHAGVTVGATDTAKRERLCRYLARPPVAHDRLSLTRDGRVAYALKTPYRDGTTHVILEPQRLHRAAGGAGAGAAFPPHALPRRVRAARAVAVPHRGAGDRYGSSPA